jgi:hypothetical protein
MYEGLSTPYKEKRKRLSPTKIVILVFVALLVAAAIGYCVFWRLRVDAVFDKFYNENNPEYITWVDEPFILQFVGYVSIQRRDGDVIVGINPDIFTDELTDYHVLIVYKRTSDENGDFSYSQGVQLDEDWRAYASNTAPGIDVQALVDEHRAEIQDLFDEVYRRWGYKLPLDSAGGS